MMSELRILTQSDVADLLKTHVDTITTLREMKYLKFIKIGKRFLTTEKWVTEFLDEFQGQDLSHHN